MPTLQNTLTMRASANLIRYASVAFAVAVSLSIILPAAAQRDRDRDRGRERWDDSRPVAPTPMEEMRRAEDAFADDLQRRRAGLLREGSLLIGARATVHIDEESGEWRARLFIEERTEQPHESRDMMLLPNSYLGELQQIVQATPTQRITFEMVGQTMVHDGRNHLLLRAPARVIGLERIEAEGEEAAAAPDQPEREADRPTPRGRTGRRAADVMRELEREAGPLHRAPIIPRPPAARPSPGSPEATDPRRTAPGQRGADASGDRRQWREGTMLIQRRGRVTRDGYGAFRFVFDADAQGLSDPPLTLLPCLLLERVERFTRQAGPAAAVLISGEVFVHDGRAYLLPSTFQLPRERTPLN